MATPIYLTGFEHGLVSASGAGLYQAVTGAPTADSTVPQHGAGTYSLKIVHTGTATSVRPYNVNGKTLLVGVFYVRKTANPSNNQTYLQSFSAAAGNAFRIGFQTDGHIYASIGNPAGTTSGTQTINGPTVNNDTWVRVDWRADVGSNPRTYDWQVDGVAQTSCSSAEAGSTFTDSWTLGSNLLTQTLTYYWDDVILSETTGDYPIGDVDVLALLPGADGTHNTGGTVFIDSDTNTSPNFTNSTTTAYTFLDDAPPWTTARSTTDNISAENHVAGEYMEIAPATAASGKANAIGVRALLSYSSVTSTANGGSATTIRNSAGTETEIFGNFTTGQDYSESTNFFKGAIASPPAAGWTKTEIEALRWRIGRATNSSDVNPRPTWQALMLEIAYPQAAPATSLITAHRTTRNTLLRR